MICICRVGREGSDSRVGTSDSGKQFTVVDQEFTILADGTVEIRKAGATVRRVP